MEGYRAGIEGLREQVERRREAAAATLERLNGALGPLHHAVLGKGHQNEIAALDARATAILGEARAETDPGALMKAAQDVDLVIDGLEKIGARATALLQEIHDPVLDDPPGRDFASVYEAASALHTLIDEEVSTSMGVARAQLDVAGRPVHLLVARCHAAVGDNTRPPVWPYHSLVAAVSIHLPDVDVYLHEPLAIVIAMFSKPLVPGEPDFHSRFTTRGNLDVARVLLTHDVCQTLTERVDAKPRIQLRRGRLLVSWIEGVKHVPAMVKLIGHCLEALTPS